MIDVFNITAAERVRINNSGFEDAIKFRIVFPGIIDQLTGQKPLERYAVFGVPSGFLTCDMLDDHMEIMNQALVEQLRERLTSDDLTSLLSALKTRARLLII